MRGAPYRTSSPQQSHNTALYSSFSLLHLCFCWLWPYACYNVDSCPAPIRLRVGTRYCPTAVICDRVRAGLYRKGWVLCYSQWWCILWWWFIQYCVYLMQYYAMEWHPSFMHCPHCKHSYLVCSCVVLIPLPCIFRATWPFETLLVPKRHVLRLTDLREEEKIGEWVLVGSIAHHIQQNLHTVM